MKKCRKMVAVSLFTCIFALSVTAQDKNASPASNPLWTSSCPGLFLFAAGESSISLRMASADNKAIINASLDPATGAISTISEEAIPESEMTQIRSYRQFLLSPTSPMWQSPDGSLIALSSKSGLTVRSSTNYALVRTIEKPAKGEVSWYFLSNQIVLRVAGKDTSIFNVSDGSEKVLDLGGGLGTGSVLMRGPFTYLVTMKSIFKLNASTGDILWQTSDVVLFASIFTNNQISVLHQETGVLWVATSVLDVNSGAMTNTKIYVLDPETGRLLVPAFPSRAIFTKKYVESGEIVSNVSNQGDNRFLITAYNASLIDIKGGKEIYANGKVGSLTAVAGNQYVCFESDGKFLSIDLATKKPAKKINLGTDILAAKKIAGNYWLIGSERGKAALLILRGEDFSEIQRFKTQKVDVLDFNEKGAVFVAGSKFHYFNADASKVSIDLPVELNTSKVLKVILAEAGTSAWLLSADTILLVDIVNQKVQNTIPWKAETWFGAAAKEIANAILVHRGNNLFITKKPALENGLLGLRAPIVPVELLAFDLRDNQQKWNITVLSDSLLPFDAANVMVVRKEDKVFMALPYPDGK